ncbi:hypothetical protein [Frondihabitans cladoniiphilus]|uniref:Uncharacterized protein n=1 Tax=Frondihabitans cladoniiphilus TaxID=715785 RepID=A0ABP8WCB8_9MICO
MSQPNRSARPSAPPEHPTLSSARLRRRRPRLASFAPVAVGPVVALGLIALTVTIALTACTQQKSATSGSSTGSGTGQPTWTSLLSAPVPALCGNRAGTLKRGLETGATSSGAGTVRLAQDIIAAGTARNPKTATAPTSAAITSQPTGTAVIAAVVQCTRGGLEYPDTVVFWDRGMHVVASADLLDFAPGPVGVVQDVSVSSAGFHVRWVAGVGAGSTAGARAGAGAAGTATATSGQPLSAEASFQIAGGRPVSGDLRVADGHQAVEADVAAAVEKNAAAVVGTESARTQLADLVKSGVTFAPGTARCSGVVPPADSAAGAGGDGAAGAGSAGAGGAGSESSVTLATPLSGPTVACTADLASDSSHAPGSVSFRLIFAAWNDYVLTSAALAP